MRGNPDNVIWRIQLKSKFEILQMAADLRKAGEFYQAENILLELVQSQPDFAPVYNSLGSVYFVQSLWAKAEKAYRSAIECQADYADAYYNLGLTLTRLQRDREALTVYQALIELNPQHIGALFQLGCLLMKQYQFQMAVHYFNNLLQIYPMHAESLINLAACYLKLNQLQHAETYYLRALDIEPNDVQVLFNLGVIYSQQGLTDEAINYYLRAVIAAPDCYAAYNNLGVSFIALNDRQQALKYFREALRIQPDNVALKHTVEVLAHASTAVISPPEYISALFDFYAPHYDPHVAQGLRYTVPQLFIQLIQDKKNHPKDWDIVDLGCGTGLCGELIKPWARTLTGVDLSEGMLAIAQQKQIYDTLIQADALSFLLTQSQAFDLVMAGDMLVYVGDLSTIFSAIYQTLKAGGLFVFNLEQAEQGTYVLLPSGRFAHAKPYVDSLITQVGFNVVTYESAMLRQQGGQAVEGHIYLLVKPW